MAVRRDGLLATLGPNAALVIKLLPELRFGIGEPTPRRPTCHRSKLGHACTWCFRQFLPVLAGAGNVLLLCLHDRHWLDAASLKVLAHLVGHPDLRRVLVVGAYRVSEVGSAHPLALTGESLHPQRGRAALGGAAAA